MTFINYHLLITAFTILIASNTISALSQNHFLIDHVASITPTRTTSPQHQRTFRIHARNLTTATSTIDFASIPTCALTKCVYPGDSSSTTAITCSKIPAPCPSGLGNNCSTFDHSCYCNLPKPLECAFHPCPWIDVMLMENWFNKTCPEVWPSIRDRFKVGSAEVFLPSCAKNCIHEQVMFYGCTSESINCFCSHDSLFGCTATCGKAEKSTIATWLAATCQILAQDAADRVEKDRLDDSEAKDGGPTPPHRRRPFRWYELLGIVVFSSTMGMLLISAIVIECLKRSS